MYALGTMKCVVAGWQRHIRLTEEEHVIQTGVALEAINIFTDAVFANF